MGHPDCRYGHGPAEGRTTSVLGGCGVCSDLDCGIMGQKLFFWFSDFLLAARALANDILWCKSKMSNAEIAL